MTTRSRVSIGPPRRRSAVGSSGCVARRATAFPSASLPSATGWPCTAGTASRARTAGRRCSASSTPKTRPTTARGARRAARSEEHTSELQSRQYLVCRLLLEKKKKKKKKNVKHKQYRKTTTVTIETQNIK